MQSITQRPKLLLLQVETGSVLPWNSSVCAVSRHAQCAAKWVFASAALKLNSEERSAACLCVVRAACTVAVLCCFQCVKWTNGSQFHPQNLQPCSNELDAKSVRRFLTLLMFEEPIAEPNCSMIGQLTRPYHRTSKCCDLRPAWQLPGFLLRGAIGMSGLV